MPTNQIVRPRYFEGQFLGAADLTAAIDYARLEDARHSLGGHTWGIAAGLEIKEQPSPAGGGQVDVFVQPGYAWDGFGRPIVVLSPFPIRAALFASFAFDAGKPNGYAVSVWLRYQETATQGARPGFELCQGSDQNSRIDEGFQIEVGPRPGHPDQHDQVSVGGRSADAQQILKAFDPAAPELFDESVSYQAFPESGERSRWLVPLGDVFWKPDPNPNTPGTFAPIPANELQISLSRRKYIGVVAGSIESPGAVATPNGVISGHIRLHDRTKVYSAVVSDDLVWVEGSLRIEGGDLRLFNGKVDFRDNLGLDRGITLQFQRADPVAGGASIQTVIGTGNAGNNTFAVGPLAANVFKPKLVVRDDGRVGIGTDTPAAPLHISGQGDQFLDVSSTDAGRPSYTRLLAVTSNAATESQLQFNNMFSLAAPIVGAQRLFTVLDSGNVGIGTIGPLNSLHVARGSHLNAIFDRTDTSDHLTAVVGSVGSGFRFSDSNFFFIGAQPYADRNSNNVGTELFRITAAGDAGIGTATPADKLDVFGSARLLSGGNPLRFTSAWSDFPNSATNRAEICNDTGGFRTLMIVGNRSNNGVTRRVSVWDTLEVNGLLQVIGDTRLITPRLQLGAKWLLSGVGDAHAPNDTWLRLFDINNTGYFGGFATGRLWAETGVLESSDAELKHDIAPLYNAREGLLALRGVRFTRRSNQKQHIGLIAQDVEKVFPELVETGPDGFKGIYSSGLFGAIIEAMKEQHEEIQQLRLEVTQLSEKT
jgi:hypothetical protein